MYSNVGNATVLGAAGLQSEATRRHVVLIALLGTLVSLAIRPFEYGVHNNVYHIPYVLDWQELPQFADDAFYQSLRYFTSAVWYLVRLVSTEENVVAVFAACHTVLRFATIYLFALLFIAMGISRVGTLACAIFVASASFWLLGGSSLANHGLLISYFTHSEVAWPFFLLTLLATIRRAWVKAAAAAALTFLANAFVGFWLVAIVGSWVLSQGIRIPLRQLAAAAGTYLVLAAPVAIWISLALKGAGDAPKFSFKEYVDLYYPKHFLLDRETIPRLFNLALVIVAGYAASSLVSNRRFWRVVLLASAGVFVVGAVHPFLLDSRLLFNLHLMRVDGVIQLISAMVIIAASVITLTGKSSVLSRCAAILTVCVLCVPWRINPPTLAALALLMTIGHPAISTRFSEHLSRLFRGLSETRQVSVSLLIVVILVIPPTIAYTILRPFPAQQFGWILWPLLIGAMYLARRRIASLQRPAPSSIGIAMVLVVATTVAFAPHDDWLQGLQKPSARTVEDWTNLTDWVRGYQLDGSVLVPIEDLDDSSKSYLLTQNFQLHARASVWVDWKQGAAAMWYPPFYRQWAERYLAARELRTPEEMGAFAQERGIPYFVISAPELAACPPPSATLHHAGQFALCASRPSKG